MAKNYNTNEPKRLEREDFIAVVRKEIEKQPALLKERRALKSQVEALLGKRQRVLAETFYEVSKLVNLDIDVISKKLFKKHVFHKISFSVASDNKLEEFLLPFLHDARSIAGAAGIENSRLSRLLSGEFAHLYPHEIYGLARAFGLNPTQLFDYFYGGAERPTVGL